tara:strand:+ start:2741 stop:3958 length:1218 start_codon:yes stop_codon:yes gene_type:complete
MKTSVLYISYTGLLDPLGQSQVLQYVAGLASNHQMTLLTFEKREALRETVLMTDLKEQCRKAGVDWHHLNYHNSPNMPATLYDVMMGVRIGVRLAREANASVVHCRSYLASLMGLLIKRVTGARHIFDMRGFWPDERVDGGIWQKDSFKYRIFKRLERALFQHTDHVVSLTHSGEAEIRQFDYLLERPPPISVIPTCTNLNIFKPSDLARQRVEEFTLGYVGSAGSWYMFDKVARVVRRLFNTRPGSRFLVINKGGHEFIRRELLSADVDLNRVEIRAVPFHDVAEEISRMDAGIFFYQSDWSRRATCPTRLGEFLAMGKPCLANGGVGDVEKVLGETRTGIVINDMQPETLNHALDQLIAICGEPGVSGRCRAAAADQFSLRRGIERYTAIYASLASEAQQKPR